MENIAISIASISTILSVVATIIGLVNAKSKNDKADARKLADLELKLETKVGEVAFTELSIKIDNLTKMVDKLNQDMHSVLNDNNINASTLAVDNQKIESLEARVKRIEGRIFKED